MQINKEKYGTLNGYLKWDLTLDWLIHSNDSFYNNYGFSFVPSTELLNEVKEYIVDMEL